MMLPVGAVPTESGYVQVMNPEHRYLGPQSSGCKITIMSGGVLRMWFADNASVGFDGPGTPRRWRYVGSHLNRWVDALPDEAIAALRSVRGS
jgi:hypothetical protein